MIATLNPFSLLPARLQAPARSVTKMLSLALVNLFALYLVVALYAQQQLAFAVLVLVVVGGATWVFVHPKLYAHRYVFPAIAGMLVFIIFPLLYTIGIGFTNYSASNLLDLERVQKYHLSQTYTQGASLGFELYQQGEHYQLVLSDVDGQRYQSPTFKLPLETEAPLTLQLQQSSLQPQAPLAIRDIIARKKELQSLRLQLAERQLQMNGLRSFAEVSALYTLLEDGRLQNQQTGEVLSPNFELGFYQKADGSTVAPGFAVNVGWRNFVKVVTDTSIREPFLQIFVWTLMFSTLTVLFTLAVGLTLASLMQWELIRGKGFYRVMLILPYAVPAFISILVFKGLFNQNFGEINMLLSGLFGLRPDWFSDPTLARSMIIIVNTWLGYPYMMLLCMGLLQAIPQDLYEASAMDGAGPLDNLFKITLPLIIKPLTPLLIASFAYNFNNFVLIALLTEGSPDIIGATTPAGMTDLLVSYTYRIAFQDSGQDFGLAAAISTLIFLLVGALALLNLKISKVQV
ncbi:maltose ABC transporter permease MalF [Balneatrix alpica]|uniref:Maltose/maltodextrin transport system permease protein n=1 Tax=Balneatrix alpica TaxID=75684 RepID=A0ABV5ZFX6_9GAMM|nr:maltose ABC transporter permease MalF [Balneatrix alpica]